MAIKRGVSLYSYQQTQFFGNFDWKAQVKEVRENLKTDGIEIIDEQVIRDYPFPSDEFVYDWNSYLARYEMNAVTMDVYFDVHQFRDHIMNHREGAERLKYDIKIASKLGFKNVRCLSAVPIDVIEMALPTAEKYDVRIGKEIHAPIPIKAVKNKSYDTMYFSKRAANLTEQIIELRERTGSKHVGLVPDFGIFQHSPSQVWIDFAKRNAKIPEAVDFVLSASADYSEADLPKATDEKYPGHGLSPNMFRRLSLNESASKPEEITDIVPYIVSIHGKFYNMTEIPGEPGHYEDLCIDYANPIRLLVENGYEGYINSEFEGQRDRQDMGLEGLVSEIEQVRRHQEMLERLGQ